MAYFSKDIYDKKRDYAYRISSEGLEKIAETLVAEDPKYKNVDLDDDKVIDSIDKDIQNLIYELEPIQDLSHRRHSIHSDGDDCHLDWWDNTIEDIIDNVNGLNKKYSLVNKQVHGIDIEEEGIDFDWDNWLICDSLDLNEDEYLDEYGYWKDDDKKDEVYELTCEENRRLKDKWSEGVREWFSGLNKKFDTDFPD